MKDIYARGRTKVVATVGPASRDPEVLRALIGAGVDVFRLNFSHGTHEGHHKALADIRRIAQSVPIAVMADLQGPRIRVGEVAGGEAVLRDGAAFTLTARVVPGDSACASVTYSDLPSDVRPGDHVLIDDGLIDLAVESVAGPDIGCRVIHGGTLKTHKGINLPGVAVSAPTFTDKDREDLRAAIAAGVDLVAVSFVRRAEDLRAVRKAALACGRAVPLVAKIERPEAVAALDEVLAESDAVMVARGDLGVELGTEAVPVQQKRIIAAANAAGIPVITATQMLESMTANARPTRAEASDVANAIYDGTDAVMLSAETASGRFPVEAVRTMHRIAVVAEAAIREAGGPPRRAAAVGGRASCARATVHAAVMAASDIGARAIVCFTRSGATARLVAQRRPDALVVAFTPDESACRWMNLSWGVTPLMIRVGDRTEDLIREGERRLLEECLVARGDTVVMIAGSNTLPGATNLIKIHRVGEGQP